MSAHAILSASGAHRWMACPGSVAASVGVPERASPHAEEGTAAHEQAARCLRRGVRAAEPAIQLHLDTVRASREPGDTLLIEHQIDLGPLDPPLPMFGTADVIVIKPKRRQLHVIDLKYGSGVPVDAENNPQTRYYALGALLGPARDHAIDMLELVVVQPRIPHPAGPVRREILTALELLAWGRELLAAAHRALAPDSPLVPGAWCRFCPAALTCPALHEQSLASAQDDFILL